MASTDNTEPIEKAPPLKLSDLKKEAKILEEYFNLASVSNVNSHQPKAGGPITFTFTYNQRKLAANSRRSVVLSSTLLDPCDLDSFTPVSLPFEIQDCIVYSSSPSRTQTFLVRSGDTPEAVVLEIWQGPRCTRRLQVPSTLHGSVLNDGQFSGGASWSKDETKVAYVAESPPKEALTDWGKEEDEGSEKTEKSEPKLTSKTWKGVSPWDQSWGEGFTNIKSPSIFVFDLKSLSVLSFKKQMSDSSFGQPIWTPNDVGLVCVEWPHYQSNFKDVAMKLGYRHCKNRPCNLHYIPLEAATDESKGTVCLTPNLKSACLPSFSPNGKTLMFVSNEHAAEVGIHASLSRLYTMDWSQVESKLNDEKLDLSQYTKLIIGDIARPLPPLNFPGLVLLKEDPMSCPFISTLCIYQLIQQLSFLGLDDDEVVLSAEWGFQAVIISARLSTGEVSPLNPVGMTKESYNLLCSKSGVLIASRASLTSAPCLVARRVDSDDSPWIKLAKELQPTVELIVQEALETLEQHEIKFQPKNYPNGITESPVPCEAVIVKRKDASKPQPTILIPHGGPHSSMIQVYSATYVLLCSLGMTAVAVNFRGSINYGTDFTMALPGHVGTVDVEDCVQAIDECIAKGYTDPKKICVSGGSHGGFLAGHLVGQFPDKFRCAILRNPALTLDHMVYTSDIPDWIFVEALGTKGRELFTTLPQAEVLKKFHEKSATRYVDQVKTPMLFLLGALDARVPHSDALRYISTLKSRKDHPEIRVVVFPSDRHSLDSPQTEFESVMNIIWWLKKHEMLEWTI
eukprot:g4027.t1